MQLSETIDSATLHIDGRQWARSFRNALVRVAFRVAQQR
jgi:hypothetical protein